MEQTWVRFHILLFACLRTKLENLDCYSLRVLDLKWLKFGQLNLCE